MTSKTFGPETARRPHLVRDGKSGIGGEVGDLRSDVESAIAKLELHTGFPELDWMDGATITAVGGDIILEGRELLQGKAFAALTIGAATSELVITALKPGTPGNDYTVVVTASGGGQTIALVGTVLTIDCQDGVTTADQIATLINANGADTDGILRCASGGAGTVHPPAVSAALTGGTGDGFTCLVSGVEALPANTPGTAGAAAIDNGTATVTVGDLTAETPARAATDVVAVVIESDGLRTGQLSAALA